MMKPDPDCEGITPLDTLFEFLVQAVMERDAAERKGKRRKYDRAYGQVQAMGYSVAMIRNPYRPDWQKEIAAAEMEASTR